MTPDSTPQLDPAGGRWSVLTVGISLTGALWIAGCATTRIAPLPSEAVIAEPPPGSAPTLGRTWDETKAVAYPALTSGPADGVPVAELLSSHDHGRWGRAETSWDGRATLEWSDDDRPQAARSARAGWILGAESRVQFVVLRDFASAPIADTPEAFATQLVPQGPAHVCRAAGPPREVVFIAAGRGIAWVLGELGAGWVLDRVEHFPQALGAQGWVEARLAGLCEPLFEVDADGRLRRAGDRS